MISVDFGFVTVPSAPKGSSCCLSAMSAEWWT